MVESQYPARGRYNAVIATVCALTVGIALGYFFGKENGITEGTNKAKEFDTVYVRQPDGTPLKKEYVLRVVSNNGANSDDTTLRNDPNVWRIYIHEIDLVVYLVPRLVKD